jgi:hypothetical protein
VITTKSAGTFKLGLHGNMEGDACTHNLTRPCISKTHWLHNQNTHTEREKIKTELSDKYTHQHTQDASLVTQNHEKSPQKNKIKKEKYNYNINSKPNHLCIFVFFRLRKIK